MFPVSPRGVGRDDADTLGGVKGPSGASRRATSKWARCGPSRSAVSHGVGLGASDPGPERTRVK